MIKIIKHQDEVASYLVVKNNQAFLIDPGNHFEEIEDYLLKNNISLVAIFVTNGHFRHFEEIEYFLLKYPLITIYIKKEHKQSLYNSQKNKSNLHNKEISIGKEYCKKIVSLSKGTFTIIGYVIWVINNSKTRNNTLGFVINDHFIVFIGQWLKVETWENIAKYLKKTLVKNQEYLIYPSYSEVKILKT